MASPPDDRVALKLPAPEGHPYPHRVRWWWIRQPVPSVAFELQGRIAACLGAAGEHAVRALFADEDQAVDLAGDVATVGEPLAMRTLRRARSGRGIAEPWPNADLAECTSRLWAVLRLAAERGGPTVNALALLGQAERLPGGPGHRWASPSLLHRLLLFSGLRYDGEGPQPLGPLPEGPPPGDAPADVVLRAGLRDAVAEGSTGRFMDALDSLLASPDELALLSAWAVLHLWRPF